MLTEFWSFSSYTAAGLAAVAIPGLVMVPEYFWSRWLQFTSAVNARFLTGVQNHVATDDCEVEVGVATRQTIRWGQGGHEVGADQGLARIAILQLSIATVDAAGPVGIPVMGETTAEAPGLDGIDSGTNAEDAIGKTGETGALIRADAATAKHEEALREQALEVVARCTVGVDGLHVDAVASSRRDVLDRQRRLRCPAPLVT